MTYQDYIDFLKEGLPGLDLYKIQLGEDGNYRITKRVGPLLDPILAYAALQEGVPIHFGPMVITPKASTRNDANENK